MRGLLSLATVSLLTTTTAGAVTVKFGGIDDPTNGLQTRFQPVSSNDSIGVDTMGPQQENVPGDGRCSGPDPAQHIVLDGSQGLNSGSSASYFDSQPKVRLQPNGAGTSGCYTIVNDLDISGMQQFTGSSDFMDAVAYGTTDTYLTYLGFLWGSPDSYNYLQFVDSAGRVVPTLNAFGGLDTNNDGILTGDEIYKTADGGGFSSDPGNAGTRFINFMFDPLEHVQGVRIGSNGNCCFEFTNLTTATFDVTDPTPNIGLTTGFQPNASHRTGALAVPEPGTALALGAGLGMIGFTRRKRG